MKKSTARKYRRLFALTIVMVSAVCVVLAATLFPYLSSQAEEPGAAEWLKCVAKNSIFTTAQWLAIQIVVWTWVFALGSSIGSFLNVLVYRLPRGKTILGGSKCPFCAVPIKGYYNIPVFGWLWLGGRCSACRLPIATRYPVVELISGLAFLYLFVLQLLFNGGDIGEPIHGQGVTRSSLDVVNVFRLETVVILKYFWACVLFSAMLTIGLIQWDRQPLPIATLIGLLLFGLVVTMFLPAVLVLEPIAFKFANGSQLVEGCVTGLLSLLIVNLFALLVYQLGKRQLESCHPGDRKQEIQLINLITVILMLGIWVGWQGMLMMIAIGSMIQYALQRMPSQPNDETTKNVQRSWLLSITFSSLFLQGVDRLLVKYTIWPSYGDSVWFSILWAVLAIVFILLVLAERRIVIDGSARPHDQQAQIPLGYHGGDFSSD